MNHKFDTLLNELTPVQHTVVNWQKGPLFVLAGPRSEKSKVLALRIAHLLIGRRINRPRVLILTSSDKVIKELTLYLNSMIPELMDRVNFRKLHEYCAQMLRLHGFNIGIKSDFRVCSHISDRLSVVYDAIHNDSQVAGYDIPRFLPLIDRLKSQGLTPENAKDLFSQGLGSLSSDDIRTLYRIYRRYEDVLKEEHVMDYNSVISKVTKLFEYPRMVEYYQNVNNYWLIDHFQTMTDIEIHLLQRMFSNGFRKITAIADDDPMAPDRIILLQDRMAQVVSDLGYDVIQLPSNMECPPQLVEVANHLRVYRTQPNGNQSSQAPLTNGQPLNTELIRYVEYSTDTDEVSGIVSEIFKMNDDQRSRTLVIAQSQSLLQLIYDELQIKEIYATILVHRDDFVSPKMRWIMACLRQIFRPLDLQNFAKLVHSFNAFSPTDIDSDDIVVHATAQSTIYFSLWIDFVQKIKLSENLTGSVAAFKSLQERSITPDVAIHAVIDLMNDESDDPDFQDDILLWKRVYKSLAGAIDFSSIDTLLKKFDHCHQDLSPKDGSVSLSTIQGMKGLEYDTIYLMGLAEEILPSWSSIQYEHSSLLDEERRACFLAITQTKKRVIFSRADHYHGDQKSPSRFLEEMGFLHEKASGSEEKIYAEALA
ncbi:MAG: ATP-dependent helicase [Bacteroidetes bacterium]|nr:ATP-dependent helicase [Bacteroidota bacterium]